MTQKIIAINKKITITENESLEEKLQKINMSKKKAEMILNALNVII